VIPNVLGSETLTAWPSAIGAGTEGAAVICNLFSMLAMKSPA
jgi:hypothetical protein